MADDIPPTVQAPDPNPFANPKNPNNLIERVQAILLKPLPTWDVIEGENPTVRQLYTSYIIPLAAIGPAANLIGSVVFLHMNVVIALLIAVVAYGLSLVVTYVVALIIDALAPSFNGQKSLIQALKLAAYSMTATWVAAILCLFPFLGGIASLLGLYGIYLLYLGLPKLMKNPPDKTIVYMVVTAVVCFVLNLIVWGILGSIMASAVIGAGIMGGFAQHGAIAPIVATADLNRAQAAASQLQATASQMAAQASATQNGQTVVKLADAGALLSLIPANYMGAARTNDNTSSGGVGGVAVSTAEGTYAVNGGTVRVKVSDLGSISGLGAMAAAMNVNTSSSSATGYEKVSHENGNLVTEEWDGGSKHGSYTMVTEGGRISVEVDGDNVDMATLKSVAGAIDVNRAVALTR